MNSIGSTLKEARSRKSVSFEEVHAKIRIHPRVLQLLEEEKFDKLPSPLYVKSFLRSYAEYLEVNPDEILGAYEKAALRDPEQHYYIPTADERLAGPPLRKELLVLPAAVCVLALLGFGLARAVRTVGPHWPRSAAKERPAAPKLKAAPKNEKN